MSEYIRVHCPDCGRRVKILAEHLGRRFRCHYCGHRFRIRPEAVLPPDSPSTWPSHPAVLSNGNREIEPARAEWDRSRGASPELSDEEPDSCVLGAERPLEEEGARAAEREQFAEASRRWEEQVTALRGEVESASPMAEAAHRQAGESARGPGNVLQEQFERLAELEGLVNSLRRDYEAALRDAEQRHRAEIARLHAAFSTARQPPDAADRGGRGSIAVPASVHGGRTHHES